jgi:hypothetical protein
MSDWGLDDLCFEIFMSARVRVRDLEPRERAWCWDWLSKVARRESEKIRATNQMEEA